MRPVPFLAAAALALWAGPAAAQTTCDPSLQTTWCEGNDMAFCDEAGTVQTLPCSDLSATCGTVDGMGVCVVPAGGTCAYDDGQGGVLVFPCGSGGVKSSSMGCDYVDGCVTGVSACQAGSTTGGCAGDRLVAGCGPYDQPILFDCASEGGACELSRCVMPAYSECDDGLFVCEDGSTCEGATSTAAGTCFPDDGDVDEPIDEPIDEPVDDEPADPKDTGSTGAGPVGDDDDRDRRSARRDALRDPARGFSCASVQGAAPSALFLLAVVALRRRRGGP